MTQKSDLAGAGVVVREAPLRRDPDCLCRSDIAPRIDHARGIFVPAFQLLVEVLELTPQCTAVKRGTLRNAQRMAQRRRRAATAESRPQNIRERVAADTRIV